MNTQCFNSSQVGYKHMLKTDLKEVMKMVSIPHRLATNIVTEYDLFGYYEQFQFLIGWLQTQYGAAAMTEGCTRFNSSQVGYKLGLCGFIMFVI